MVRSLDSKNARFLDVAASLNIIRTRDSGYREGGCLPSQHKTEVRKQRFVSSRVAVGRSYHLLHSHGPNQMAGLADAVRFVHEADCNIVDIRFQAVGELHHDCWVQAEGSPQAIYGLACLAAEHPLFQCAFPKIKISGGPILVGYDHIRLMRVTCADHAGHVRSLVRAARNWRANIVSLRGHQRPAPMAGVVFDTFVVMDGPADPAVWAGFRRELEQVEAEYGVVVHGPCCEDDVGGGLSWIARN